jgi:hypothetical protein
MTDECRRDDLIALAGCSLAKTPGIKDSWIEGVGGHLPNYICRVAKHIRANGSTTSSAIAQAISTIKRWARGGNNVKADTQAKAVIAVAQWTALKAKAGSKKVGLSQPTDYGFEVVDSTHFSLNHARESFLSSRPDFSQLFVAEVWTDHLIVLGNEKEFVVAFDFDEDDNEFRFGEMIELVTFRVPVNGLSDDELQELLDNDEDEDEDEDEDAAAPTNESIEATIDTEGSPVDVVQVTKDARTLPMENLSALRAKIDTSSKF